MDLARLLVRGEAFGDESAEVFFKFAGGDRAFAQHDKGYGNFTGASVGAPDYAAIAGRGMLKQQSFALGRRDREAFVLDHLLAAIDHEIEIVCVTGDDVARPVPSIAKHGRGSLRIVPVTQHELR